jgi:hypothetical protein
MEGVKVPVSDTPWDNPRDVDGGVLLLTAHHVEAESLLCLGQLNHPSRKKQNYWTDEQSIDKTNRSKSVSTIYLVKNK